MERKSVVVAGSLNYDIICKLSRMPRRGETFTAGSAEFCSGGKGANQAVQCARLGLETYLAGAVGADAMGAFLRETVVSYGVRAGWLKTLPGCSGMGLVNALDDGSVFATIVQGANGCVTKEDIDALKPLLAAAGLLILQLEIPIPVVEYAIAAAKEAACPVLLNAAPAAPLSPAALAGCEIVVVNEVEAGFYAEGPVDSADSAARAAMELCGRYGNKWVVTLGGEGAVLCDGRRAQAIPAWDVPAVETTGAGDSFIGGMAWGLMNGKDLFDAARFASCCSAVTIQQVGAQNAMPDLAQAVAFAERHGEKI